MELSDPAHEQTQQICGVLIYIHVSVSCNCSSLLSGRTGPSESPPHYHHPAKSPKLLWIGWETPQNAGSPPAAVC